MTTLIPKFDLKNGGATPAGAVNRTIYEKLTDSISVKDFGATGNGATDDTAAIQAAVSSLTSGGCVNIPAGVYLVSAAITIPNNVTVQGVGDSSQILANTDITVFTTSTATTATIASGIVIQNLYINNTVSGTKTKYDIILYNPNVCKIINVHIFSASLGYSNTNVGGIWLERPSVGGAATAFVNLIKDCFVQNNSIYLNNISDSQITGGYVWGFNRSYAILLSNCGDIEVSNSGGIIPSQYNGGVYLLGVCNQIRIVNNYFDGNNSGVITGVGIYSPQPQSSTSGSTATVVVGNTFFLMQKESINLNDPIGWSITGNCFYNGNATNNFISDVLIIGQAIQPQGNTVTGNSFENDGPRTNAGYAIQEFNNGNNPTLNTYCGNSFSGAYNSPVIVSLANSVIAGNVGINSEYLNKLGGFTGNLLLSSNSSFGGTGVLVLPPSTPPTSTFATGGILYVDAGALKFRGGSGTITTVAPA
jgi:hypothetical protein